MIQKLKEMLFGPPKSPLDSRVFERISLVAFLAWVGLGADGLSSSCYGPEAAYRQLGDHHSLAPLLALATVLTVSVLSAGYAFTIEAFPSGGGGYTVATKTLGRPAGMLCGCALVVDYALTIAMSIAAGADAVFSMLPPQALSYKFAAAVAGAALLVLLNLRGVRESILFLLPIFVLFLVMHALLLALAAFVGAGAPTPAAAVPAGPSLGVGAAALLLIQAYSYGAGTYTGIEAVSNSLTILREPRVKTARITMLYMAVSLSVVAGGLLLGYLGMRAVPESGRTLNAVLASRVFEFAPGGNILVYLTLLSEALLLAVAAQAGFIAGPRMLASMAVDSWVPRWFSRLSDRLVVSNGILLMGLGGIAAIVLTRGHVERLVVVYSFSVFVTFLLSQAGMVRYWFANRDRRWFLRAGVSALATLLAAVVLVALLHTHGTSAAGITAAVILGLAVVALTVRAHYAWVTRRIARLEQLVDAVLDDPHRSALQSRDPSQPTAVFLVNGFNGAGMHTLLWVQRLFGQHFRQMVFLSVGVIDFDRFKGRSEVDNLRGKVESDLARYVDLVGRWGFPAEGRLAIGVDVVAELEELCAGVARDYSRAVFFCGDLVYQWPSFLTRLLHERTAEEIRRRLHLRGLPVLIAPIRISAA